MQGVCQEKKLNLAKVVIPNPIGPMENEDRLIPILVENARKKSTFKIRSPEALSDYLPASSLGEIYVHLANQLVEQKEYDPSPSIVRPSGETQNVRDWTGIVNQELIKERLQLETLFIGIWGFSRKFLLQSKRRKTKDRLGQFLGPLRFLHQVTLLRHALLVLLTENEIDSLDDSN